MTRDLETVGETRAIADQLLGIFDRLREIEEQKRRTPLGTDEFVDLAIEAEEQGRLLFRWTGLQLEMAHTAARQRAQGTLVSDIRIVDVQPRTLDRILAAWREAQIRLEIARPGTPEALEAADMVERHREEYRRVAEAKADAVGTPTASEHLRG
jgi:hypothetical protein